MGTEYDRKVAGGGASNAMFAILLAGTTAAAQPAGPELVTVGGGTVEVHIGPPEPSVPRPALLRWVKRCATAVSAYFGRFPVENVRLNVITGSPGQIGNGMTWGGRGPVIRVSVGRDTKEADFESDWLLTHEMTHLAFPDMEEEHHWIEEGLATYVEPVARAQIGWIRPPEVWGGLADGLPKGLFRQRGQGLDGTRSWGRTYWGGALFWLLAELDLREKTKNRKGLPDALRGLQAAGGSIRVHWPIARALEAADEATGTRVLRDLYARMGPSPMDVDLDAIWNRLGIRRERGQVTFDDSAPLARIRRTITKPAE
ncbi:MAG TPA: hypothetical protein VIC87_18870 [Vicinamibacteria bacterium]